MGTLGPLVDIWALIYSTTGDIPFAAYKLRSYNLYSNQDVWACATTIINFRLHTRFFDGVDLKDSKGKEKIVEKEKKDEKKEGDIEHSGTYPHYHTTPLTFLNKLCLLFVCLLIFYYLFIVKDTTKSSQLPFIYNDESSSSSSRKEGGLSQITSMCIFLFLQLKAYIVFLSNLVYVESNLG